ncbi:MAG: PglZ domain-containing protein, partial [Anaerolineae bacterium]|nr:PglZ domain-containing protein [Anaerolineae bacterium]
LRFWRKQGLHPANVGYLRNLGVKALKDDGTLLVDDEVGLETEVEELLGNGQIEVTALVVNTVDNIMHGMQLGMAGMHQQIDLWLTRQRYMTQLVTRLLQASFTVYLTSDHGNVWARGIGRPKEGALVETRGERARVYTDPAFAQLGKGQSPTAVEWTNVGLPDQVHVLLAPQLDAFLNVGDHAICHGGIALEETIVPFVKITEETSG